MMPTKLPVSLATVLVLALVVAGAPAVALAVEPSAEPEHLSGPNVVRYAIVTTGPTFIVQGAALPNGGCRFSLQGNGLAGDPGARLDEVALDPTTCQAEIQETALVALSSPSTEGSSAGGGTARGRVGVGGSVGPYYGGGATCANPYADNHYYPREACIHSWFEDPVHLHVNDLTNEVQWTPGNGCANNGPSYASWYAQYFSPTGWYILSNQFQPAFSCSSVTSKSTTVFANTVFCVGSLTTDWYAPQLIQGFANGTYTWSVQWYQTGVCSYLLSFHTETSP